MNKKRLVFAVIIVAMLLIGSVLVAGAKDKVRVNGGINNPYAGTGWAWSQVNFTFEPFTGEADGFVKYKSYTVEKPKDFGGWYGNAICAAMGEYEGDPAVALVVQLEETDAFVVGQYIKFLIVDGGQNATEDSFGLITFPPVDEQPGCEYEPPMPFDWAVWNGAGGNITIHQ